MMVVVVIVIAMVALPSLAADVSYGATVLSGQNTVVTTSNGNFGSIMAGSEKVIFKSVNLSNSGDIDATVSAKFSTFNTTGVYGLKNTTSDKVIDGTNFYLRKNATISWTGLFNTDTYTVSITTVPAGGSIVAMDARLVTVTGGPTGTFSGTVVLLFANV